MVDADPHAGTALAQNLTSMGYAVQISTSGRQAIHLLKQVRFDVLVIDPSLLDVVLASRADLESTLVAIKCAVNGYRANQPMLRCD